MEKIVFTEAFCRPERLFPFTLTRQIQDIRVGILTIREKWEHFLKVPSFDKQEEDYKDLDKAYVIDESIGKDIVYLVHGNVLPTQKLIKQIRKLKPGEFLSLQEKENLVYCISRKQVYDQHKIKVKRAIELKEDIKEICFPWDVFQLNAWAIQEDFELLRKRRTKQRISNTNNVIGRNNIFIEKGAQVEYCILNASEGPVYIGKDAVVMEGSLIRGPVAICEGAVVKMGSKIYGATTIGPNCVVGGEIKNSVFFGNSNKSHDGYIGDSVVGEWCNLGAGTSNSNVKNNASGISVHTPDGLHNIGLKCGVFIGDYSRTAINTSINSGTVIGVCCNVFGDGLTPKYIPNFSWGSEGIKRYEFEKALGDIENWKKLKQQELTDNENIILRHIFENY